MLVLHLEKRKPNPVAQQNINLQSEAQNSNYNSMLKEELIAIALERGLDSSGTKEDIIERLLEDDSK